MDARLLLLATLLLASCGVETESRASKREPARERLRVAPRAGFDSYVLALSWSPEYCAQEGRNDRVQCGSTRRFGFVLHGLWPQNQRPPHPRDCAAATRVPRAIVDGMLDIMPSPRLVQHEWESHGTCSEMPVERYFARSREAFEKVQIPARYRDLERPLRTSLAELEADLQRANPGLTPESMGVTCRGRQLREVRICMSTALGFQPCQPDVRDTCRDEVILRPVR